MGQWPWLFVLLGGVRFVAEGFLVRRCERSFEGRKEGSVRLRTILNGGDLKLDLEIDLRFGRPSLYTYLLAEPARLQETDVSYHGIMLYLHYHFYASSNSISGAYPQIIILTANTKRLLGNSARYLCINQCPSGTGCCGRPIRASGVIKAKTNLGLVQ